MAWQDHDFDEEAERVMSVFRKKGYLVTRLEAWILWKMYSDSLFTSWLGFSTSDTDEKIFNELKEFFKE